MIVDTWIVVCKELRELRIGRCHRCFSSALLLILLGIFGVFLPWYVGRAWIEQPFQVLYWAWMPLVFVTTVVADSFAGERERYTLEALLASRLSDHAILAGKIVVATLIGWLTIIVWLGVGLLTVNLAYSSAAPMFYSASTVVAILSVGCLASAMAAALGVLVSLRARSAMQAQQLLAITMLILVCGALYGGQAALRFLPTAITGWVVQAVASVPPIHTVGLIVLLLVLVDAALLFFAGLEFRRTRVVLGQIS